MYKKVVHFFFFALQGKIKQIYIYLNRIFCNQLNRGMKGEKESRENLPGNIDGNLNFTVMTSTALVHIQKLTALSRLVNLHTTLTNIIPHLLILGLHVETFVDFQKLESNIEPLSKWNCDVYQVQNSVNRLNGNNRYNMFEETGIAKVSSKY